MKRILSLLLASVLLFSLASCGGSGLSDDEIRDVYADLIEKSYLLNDVYYGDGLPFVNDPETMAALAGAISRFSYMPVDQSAPLTSEKQIREATLAVFSQPMCDQIGVDVPDLVVTQSASAAGCQRKQQQRHKKKG